MSISIVDIANLTNEDINKLTKQETLEYLKRAQNTLNRRRRALIEHKELYSPAIDSIEQGVWNAISINKNATINELKHDLRTARRIASYKTGTVVLTKRWLSRRLKEVGLTKKDITQVLKDSSKDQLRRFWTVYDEWRDSMGGRLTTEGASRETIDVLGAFVEENNLSAAESYSGKNIIFAVMTDEFERTFKERVKAYEREELDESIWGPEQTS